MNTEEREKIQGKIDSLKRSAKSCLEQRVSLGRGYKGATDQLLESARSYEFQAREFEILLEELVGNE